MFSYFLPKFVKRGLNFSKDARKLLAYKRDLWSREVVAEFEGELAALTAAVRSRDAEAIDRHATRLDQLAAANMPRVRDAGMRENVEVFLVAIVVALGVRTYFLQPFTIPTGSMQPTLNGVRGYKMDTPAPNPLKRALDFALFGRTYVDVVAKEPCTVIDLREYKALWFFSRTEIVTDHGSYVANTPAEPVARYLMRPPGYTYQAGEPIARGYVDTGDHVFVDKMSYQFRKPRRSEVFVFNTKNVPTNENQRNPNGPSQFYIKRLAGLPGDQLRIAPPLLYINGKVAQERGFQRVMAQKEPGYRGYSNGPQGQPPFRILGDPEIPFTVPEKNYFALGDNSYWSSDGRDWGTVPQKNIMGCGLFVYWPFGSHWGFIK